MGGAIKPLENSPLLILPEQEVPPCRNVRLWHDYGVLLLESERAKFSQCLCNMLHVNAFNNVTFVPIQILMSVDKMFHGTMVLYFLIEQDSELSC